MALKHVERDHADELARELAAHDAPISSDSERFRISPRPIQAGEEHICPMERSDVSRFPGR
jgi:hypothetical protein